MENDGFKTFIFLEREAQPIEIYKWIALAREHLSMTPTEVFEIPFFMFVQMMQIKAGEKRRKSQRRYILESMRETRRLFGWR